VPTRLGLHNPTIVHLRNGIGVMEDTRVVRDDDHGTVGMHGVPGEQFHHGFARRMVQRSGRLVAKNQSRLMHERSREGDALLLPAGKFAGQRVQALFHAESNQQRFGSVHGFATSHARGEQWYGGVFRRRQRGQQIVLLKNKPEVLSAEKDALARRELSDVLIEELDLTSAAVEQPGDDGNQGRLPASARANEEREFSLPGVEINAAQDLHPRRALSEVLSEVATSNG